MMKKIFPLLIVIGLMAPATFAFQEPAPWKRFNSPEGKFSVLMPKDPKVEVQDVDSEVGKLTLYSYSASNSVAYLMASYGDYPREATDAAHAERVLDDVRDGVLKSLGGEKLTEVKVNIKGAGTSSAIIHPGREFTAKKIHEGSDIVFSWRIYLVGRRLYQLAVVTTKANATAPDINKFLTSFQLIG